MGVAALSWLALGAPANAGSVEGCSGAVQSLDADGNVIDAAVAKGGKVTDENGDEAFTASNPFVVDNEGSVTYVGQTDAVITDHEWSVTVMVEVASGGSANDSGTQADDGTFDTAEELPVAITGLVKADGELVGTGGSCIGSGYVKVEGNPLASPLTWAGGAFVVLGGAGVVIALPKVRPAKGVGA